MSVILAILNTVGPAEHANRLLHAESVARARYRDAEVLLFAVVVAANTKFELFINLAMRRGS
jgi:hypothetical protein